MKDKLTFAEISELWRHEKRLYVKRSTFAAYSLILKNHLLPYFGEMTYLSEEVVQEFVFAKLATKTASFVSALMSPFDTLKTARLLLASFCFNTASWEAPSTNSTL